MLDHIRKWFKEYVLAFVTAFTTVWIASPALQMMLPPKIVSGIAGIVAATSLIKLTVAGMQKPPQ